MEVLLLLGGNLGDPASALGEAERWIAERVGTVLSRSRDHWTAPWGFTDERLFLNRAVILRTALEPQELMAELLRIENELGRTRDEAKRYAARTIDIDILLIGDSVVDIPSLQVPHPRLHERAFALAPAADIAPDWRHPVKHRTVLQLLNDLRQPAV
ncbi:MAG: 2-amino-4-hydroxy-6-hydroxymethyldihydropteridine diphosphokinase [Flavobacteriales bacterium]|nr:2-amino-4-hydroxy-6-hydroxymethyldihydropteridine diphosphokinase [Flavobacteriales bacterium]